MERASLVSSEELPPVYPHLSGPARRNTCTTSWSSSLPIAREAKDCLRVHKFDNCIIQFVYAVPFWCVYFTVFFFLAGGVGDKFVEISWNTETQKMFCKENNNLNGMSFSVFLLYNLYLEKINIIFWYKLPFISGALLIVKGCHSCAAITGIWMKM